MPEGFSSIADLKVIVDANADKFHSGLQGVMSAVDDLNRKGGSSFSGLADMVDLVGGAALGVTGKMKLLAAGVETGVALYQQFAAEGRKVAEVLGVTAEYDNLKAAIDDVGMSLKDAAVGAFFEMQSAAMGASGEMQTFSANTNTADTASKGFAASLLNGVTSAINSVRLQLRLLNSENTTSAVEVDKTVALLDEKLADTRKRRLKMERGDIARYEAPNFWNDWQMVDKTVALKEREAQLESEINKQRGIRAQLPGQDWADGTQEYLSLLGSEIQQLERRNATLGMSAAKAAEYNAIVKATDDFFKSRGRLPDGDERRLINEDAARIGALAGEADAFGDANRARQRAEQQARSDRAQADRLAQSEDRLFAGGEREIQSLEQRARALKMNAGEAAELAMQERLLLQARSSGLVVDDAMLVKIKAISAEYRNQTELFEETMQAERDMQQVTGIFSSTMSSAFSQWTNGAKLSVKDMVSSVLADLARLTMQRNVFEPLFGGGDSKGGGLLGSLLGSLFGGARENGGPVEAGKAYLVGEKRPELFVPQSNGTIIPNLPSASGGGATITVPIVTHIDARGATVDAVQLIEQKLAERDARLPGEVMAIVQQGRQRGMT